MAKITMIARTTLNEGAAFRASGEVWDPEGDHGQDLAEFAGRACYQSWNRPSAKTSTNKGYIEHIIDVNHGSVLEHGSVSFYIEDVSRSLTHEFVRHRHFSYSQLSQRFVTVKPNAEHEAGVIPFVVPPLFVGDRVAGEILSAAWDYAAHAYERLLERGNALMGDGNMVQTSSAKVVREAARCVLPNMTPTAIVVTGNHRAWREFLLKRGGAGADAEIHDLAIRLLGILKETEPNVYADMYVGPDGHVWSKVEE